MIEAKERFLNAWARLPERDSRYMSLMRQVETYLGYDQPQCFEMTDGQRLVLTWTGLRDEMGGVRDDGWRIVFERQRRDPEMEGWLSVAPALVVGLYSSTLAPPWPSEASGAILRHGARQTKLVWIQGKWVVEGRGELTETLFYETLVGLLRLS